MSNEEPTDAEIIASSLEDGAQFGIIFERHADSVYRFLSTRVGFAEADDLVDEVFVTAFRVLSKYRPSSADSLPWLIGIARNVVRNHLRTKRRRPVFAPEQDLPVEHDDTGILSRVVAEQSGGPLRLAFGELTDKEQIALWLHVVEGLSLAETAERLGISKGAAASRVSRAKRTMMLRLEQMGIRPEDTLR